MLQESKQREGTVLTDHSSQILHAIVEDHMDCRVAEHGHPQQGETRRHEQYAADEFADGPPSRNTCDEQTHEGRPGQPPAPVQQGPAADPVGGLVSVEIEGFIDDVRKVGAGILYIGLQQEHRRPKQQHEQHQDHRQAQVEFGQDANTFIQAASHRKRRQCAGGGDEDDLHGGVYRQTEHMMKPAVDLQYPITQRGGHTKHRAEDGEDIHGMPYRAIDSLTDQRIECRTQG
ncbi:hypothetical protein D3C79_793510 [compost metagenome]